MNVAPEISFRHIEPTQPLRARIDKEIAHLEKMRPDIFSCNVVVTGPEHHHKSGGLPHITIRLALPGQGDIAVSNKSDDKQAHADIHVAVRDAFKAAQRQLKKTKRAPRVDGNDGSTRLFGKVSGFLRGEAGGFITSETGTEYYFQDRSVTDAAFTALQVGDGVSFRAASGDKGPQAVGVHLRRSETP